MIIRQLQRDWQMAISRSKPPVFKRYLLRKGRVTWSSNAESELWNHSCNSSNKNNATPLLPPFNRRRVSPDFTCFAVRGLAFMVMLFWNDQRGWRRQTKMTQAGWKNKWKERWCVFWKWRGGGSGVITSLQRRFVSFPFFGKWDLYQNMGKTYLTKIVLGGILPTKILGRGSMRVVRLFFVRQITVNFGD